jgi:hypothetical protein
MGLLLTVSNLYLPRFIRKRKLEMLFKATADAFQVASPSTNGLAYDSCLELYAQFTREQAIKTIRQGNELEVHSRLFQNACLIGRQFRADFNLHMAEEVMRMSTLVYKLLKIEFQGDPLGSIAIKRCFFSAYYSSEVCRLISSLDEGLLSGLSGGGRLHFSQRITEGKECCRAFLEASGRPA